MTRWLLAVMFAAVMFLAGSQVLAHHSFSATYFEGRKVIIEGEVVRFQYRNPHSFLYVTANDDQGKPQRWAIEWGGAGQLRSQNVAVDTFKPGDHVVVTGDPSRTPGEFRLRMRAITRPSDGRKWGDDFD